MPYAGYGIWYETFFHNEPLLLTDMEKLCRDMPALSKVLSPEQVRRMILIPLLAKAEVVGFVRIDDPPEKQMNAVAEMCKILSHFIVSLISTLTSSKKNPAFPAKDQPS